jgi:transposase-like protein
MTLREYLRQQEKAFIEEALKNSAGVTEAAIALGLGTTTLYRRMKQLRMFTPQRPRSRFTEEERKQLSQLRHLPDDGAAANQLTEQLLRTIRRD